METIDFHNAHLRPHSYSKPIIADLIHRDTLYFRISSYQRLKIRAGNIINLCSINIIFQNLLTTFKRLRYCQCTWRIIKFIIFHIHIFLLSCVKKFLIFKYNDMTNDKFRKVIFCDILYHCHLTFDTTASLNY